MSEPPATPDDLADYCLLPEYTEPTIALLEAFDAAIVQQDAAIAVQIMAISLMLARLESDAPLRGLVMPAMARLTEANIMAAEILFGTTPEKGSTHGH